MLGPGVARTRDPSLPPGKVVTVTELLRFGDLGDFLEVCAGEAGLSRPIAHPRIQKSGLVLAGHSHGVVPSRIQVFGETEMSFLESLSDDVARERASSLFALGLSCVVVTRGVSPGPALVSQAQATSTPLLVSAHRSSRTIAAIHYALDRLLAPSTQLHGVLVDVHGIGVLLLGPSGIGKSECALVLVERGHRLVADDTVLLQRTPSGDIEGKPPALLRHHLEVRGVGILNVRDLFGATAVRGQKRLDLVVELVPWRADEAYERLGLDDQTYPLLGADVPMLRIPVSAGRDVGLILEIAARNQLLKASGEHPARRFMSRLAESQHPPLEETEATSEESEGDESEEAS